MRQPPRLTSPLLKSVIGVDHGFFTRRGGVSEGVYDSLNVGLGSRDDPDRVQENRRRVAETFGLEPPNLVTAFQTHSAVAIAVDGPWVGSPGQADALVTNRPGLALGALSADCAPILMVDPKAQVIAAAHAGWRGALGGIVEATVAAMVDHGAARERLLAAVGPCIAQKSYEVGLEFEARFVDTALDYARFFMPAAQPDKKHFDLPAFVLSQLAAAGVARCEWVGADTCDEKADFFSNRRAVKSGEGDYGRLVSAIVIKPANRQLGSPQPSQ